MVRSGLNKLHISVLLGILLCAGCSTQKHFHLLSFFFDGVPDPEESVAGGRVEGEDFPEVDSTQLAQVVEREFLYHQPYREKDCSSCHTRDDKGVVDESLLCAGCHKGSTDSYPFEHGPRAGGFCTACHDPHRSAHEQLLRLPGNELCFSCHEQKDMEESIFHQLTGEGSCITCHDPHGGDNFSMLSSRDCFLCHEDPGQTYSYVHGPAAAGLCSSCHLSHTIEKEYKLRVDGNGLCTVCHEPDQFIVGDIHSDLEGFLCGDCHNPHGGEDKYLLD